MSKLIAKSAQVKPTVANVLKTNRQVSVDIATTASELKVVHAVLDSKLPESLREGDVSAAIERTEQLEKKLEESGAQLDDANAALEIAHKKMSD